MSWPTNPFDDPGLAARYERWYADRGRRADVLEKRLFRELLADFPHASTVLEVGCGTGHFTRWLAEHGLRAVGLDISPAMLSEARKYNGVPYLLGDAQALPFRDRAFDLVALITTLEFVADPQRALGEAVRVAKRGAILGVLNRHSWLALRRRSSNAPPWNTARFFSPRQLVRLVQSTAGQRLGSLRWRTTLWPIPAVGSLPLPWGGFIGLSLSLR